MKNLKHKSILGTAKLKSTKARSMILDVFSVAKSTLSAKEIYEKLKKDGFDKVTVYRALDSFEKAGIIRRVAKGVREAVYERNPGSDDHHHIICLKCKKMEDFTGCNAEGVVERALKKSKSFKKASHHSFDIFGFCNDCSR